MAGGTRCTVRDSFHCMAFLPWMGIRQNTWYNRKCAACSIYVIVL